MSIIEIFIVSIIFILLDRFIIRFEIKLNPELFKAINLTTRDLEEIYEYRERKKGNEN